MNKSRKKLKKTSNKIENTSPSSTSILKQLYAWIQSTHKLLIAIVAISTFLVAGYNYLKKEYIFDKDKKLLVGNWSNDTEYILNWADLELEENQPSILMIFDEIDDGSITGSILSNALCDAEPITFAIIIESDKPSIFNLFVNRVFTIKKLFHGKFIKIIELELISTKKNTIKFKKVYDVTGSLPEYIHLAKDLPKFEENWDEMEIYCAQSTRKFFRQINKK